MKQAGVGQAGVGQALSSREVQWVFTPVYGPFVRIELKVVVTGEEYLLREGQREVTKRSPVYWNALDGLAWAKKEIEKVEAVDKSLTPVV